MDPSALVSGCRPPCRSMIDSRRWPKIALLSCSTPSPSGPRWRSAKSMRRIPSRRTRLSGPMIPAIPHISVMPSRLSGLLSLKHRLFEHALVVFRTPIDEKVLDHRQVVKTNRRSAPRAVAQRPDGVIESLLVIERYDVAGCRCREKIALATTVIAHHRKTERHRLEEHQTETFVLARRYEQIGDLERAILHLVGHITQHAYAARDVALNGPLHHCLSLWSVTDDQQYATRNGDQRVYELRSGLARDHPAGSYEYEGFRRQVKFGALRTPLSRRP